MFFKRICPWDYSTLGLISAIALMLRGCHAWPFMGIDYFDVPRIDWEAYVKRLCDCPTFLVLLVHEDALGIAFKNEEDTPWCCQKWWCPWVSMLFRLDDRPNFGRRPKNGSTVTQIDWIGLGFSNWFFTVQSPQGCEYVPVVGFFFVLWVRIPV